MEILVPQVNNQINTLRAQCRTKYGDLYSSRVTPYKDLVLAHMHKTGQDLATTASGFCDILKRKNKFSEPVRATLFAAVADLRDELKLVY